MKPPLKDRLIEARIESGFDEPAVAAKKAGITPSALYQLEEGKTKALRGTTAVQLARIYPRFRVEWLIDGSGPKHHTDLRARDAYAPPYAAVAGNENAPGYVRLPLLAMEAGMGFDVASEDPPAVVQYLDIAEWWAQANLPKPYSRIQIITGRGDSNAGLINHGDIVFVDTMTNFFDGEGLYVFNWNGRPLIKRLVADMRTGTLKIISANPAYPPQEVQPDEMDSLQIAGRVPAWLTLRTY